MVVEACRRSVPGSGISGRDQSAGARSRGFRTGAETSARAARPVAGHASTGGGGTTGSAEHPTHASGQAQALGAVRYGRRGGTARGISIREATTGSGALRGPRSAPACIGHPCIGPECARAPRYRRSGPARLTFPGRSHTHPDLECAHILRGQGGANRLHQRPEVRRGRAGERTVPPRSNHPAGRPLELPGRAWPPFHATGPRGSMRGLAFRIRRSDPHIPIQLKHCS